MGIHYWKLHPQDQRHQKRKVIMTVQQLELGTKIEFIGLLFPWFLPKHRGLL